MGTPSCEDTLLNNIGEADKPPAILAYVREVKGTLLSHMSQLPWEKHRMDDPKVSALPMRLSS